MEMVDHKTLDIRPASAEMPETAKTAEWEKIPAGDTVNVKMR